MEVSHARAVFNEPVDLICDDIHGVHFVVAKAWQRLLICVQQRENPTAETCKAFRTSSHATARMGPGIVRGGGGEKKKTGRKVVEMAGYGRGGEG